MDYLYCPCPAEGCCGDKTPSYWYHGNGCGSKTMIRYNDIFIICSSCQAKGILFDWRFKCSAHDYKPASKQGVLYALSILGQHYGNEDQIHQATIALLKVWPK